MAERFKFELVSPERLLVSEEVEAVVIPGSEGEFTVMANHAPFMTTVKPGVVRVQFSGGREDRYVVFGGFADVLPEGCTLLAESSVAVAELDKNDIQQRIQDAREDLDDAKDDDSRSKAEQLIAQLSTLHDAV
ncbi:F0F1 ATP synthase subunit epsilon [Aliihoeflea sp. PC F10.4]